MGSSQRQYTSRLCRLPIGIHESDKNLAVTVPFKLGMAEEVCCMLLITFCTRLHNQRSRGDFQRTSLDQHASRGMAVLRIGPLSLSSALALALFARNCGGFKQAV